MPNELFASRGAIAAPLLLEVSRELTPADLARLHEAAATGVPVLKRLRAIHHRQAQLLGEGKTVTQVAAIVGCTVQRLVQLQNDPTFMDLMTYYQDQIIAASITDAARMRDKLVDAGEMAVDEIIARLEDDKIRAAMPVGEIRKILEMAADRTVAPPKTAAPAAIPPQAITINFGTSVRTRDDMLPAAAPTIDLAAEPQTDDDDLV